MARSEKSWLFSQARIIVFWRHPVGGDNGTQNGTRTREEARWESPNYLQAVVCKIPPFCFLTFLTHALTAATEWLDCTKEMVSKHYSTFLHWIRNWDRTVQKYVFYEAVLSITPGMSIRERLIQIAWAYTSILRIILNLMVQIVSIFSLQYVCRRNSPPKTEREAVSRKGRWKKLDMRCCKTVGNATWCQSKNQDFCAKRQLCNNHNCIGGHSRFFCANSAVQSKLRYCANH